MAVWTVSAEQGTGGDRVAACLAAAADVTLIDRDALALLAHEINPDVTGAAKIDELERRVGTGGVSLLALCAPFSPLAGEAVRELQLHHALPEIGRAVLATAARCSCVIVASGAFAALDTHCAAVHVRLRAPFDWRVAQYARENLVNHQCAEKAVRDDDHRKRAWIKSMYHVDINEAKNFSIVVDVSRFSVDRLVDTLLAAGGVPLGAPALMD
jgi:hypothetical protein